MPDLAEARARMVEPQMRRRDIRDERVLDAMARVERERFLPPELAEYVYDDVPLPIGEGQTISQPYIVALMAQAAALGPEDRVLEVGTGSGYAAAVMSLLCARVLTVERRPALAEAARHNLAVGGYGGVEVRVGDGTLGWPDEAPFDAIVVTAGGPEVPASLKRKLAIAGRLVVPVGDRGEQRLLRVTREVEDAFREEDLGGVLFVPLVGAEGWDEGGRARRKPRPASPVRVGATLPERIARAAEPLPEIGHESFATAFDRFADRRVVPLGETSHGTGEFYHARAAVTRRLVERHGFTVVAVEADWPDAASLDRRIRGRPAPEGMEPAFARFPTWMWRNREVENFIESLVAVNAGRPAFERAGFYGLDLYNLGASIRAVIDYLDRVDPEAAATARARYGCLTPWSAAPQGYGRMAKRKGYAKCEEPVVAMLRDLNARALGEAARAEPDAFLDAALSALLVKDAERYYRAMYHSSAESWNLRDRHMADTLFRLLDARGPDAKAVVWAHNSHIGDARATDMGRARGELNLGQLVRERFGAEAALVGFGTHAGRVVAADDWDEPMRIMDVNPSRPGSVERLFHDAGVARGLLDLRTAPEDLRAALAEPRLQRFIGAIYRPDTERRSHYVECALADQYDAWVWFDRTGPVAPLPAPSRPGPDETYPSGL